MSTVGLLRVRNEARWIREVVRSIHSVCDRIVVLDDNSTDDTAAICKAEGAQVIPSPYRDLNESRDKNLLLEWARVENRDWCLLIDGDEVLHPEDADVIRADIASNRGAAYRLRILYLWDAPDQVRVDGVYGRFARPSLFRYKQGQRFMATQNGGNFHCSSIPVQVMPFCQPSQARLLHYGYMLREDRLRKHAWYNEHDPDNRTEDRYQHCIQGDVPEVPAAARLKWAGPLEVRAI